MIAASRSSMRLCGSSGFRRTPFVQSCIVSINAGPKELSEKSRLSVHLNAGHYCTKITFITWRSCVPSRTPARVSARSQACSLAVPSRAPAPAKTQRTAAPVQQTRDLPDASRTRRCHCARRTPAANRPAKTPPRRGGWFTALLRPASEPIRWIPCASPRIMRTHSRLDGDPASWKISVTILVLSEVVSGARIVLQRVSQRALSRERKHGAEHKSRDI